MLVSPFGGPGAAVPAVPQAAPHNNSGLVQAETGQIGRVGLNGSMGPEQVSRAVFCPACSSTLLRWRHTSTSPKGDGGRCPDFTCSLIRYFFNYVVLKRARLVMFAQILVNLLVQQEMSVSVMYAAEPVQIMFCYVSLGELRSFLEHGYKRRTLGHMAFQFIFKLYATRYPCVSICPHNHTGHMGPSIGSTSHIIFTGPRKLSRTTKVARILRGDLRSRNRLKRQHCHFAHFSAVSAQRQGAG